MLSVLDKVTFFLSLSLLKSFSNQGEPLQLRFVL